MWEYLVIILMFYLLSLFILEKPRGVLPICKLDPALYILRDFTLGLKHIRVCLSQIIYLKLMRPMNDIDTVEVVGVEEYA